MPACTHTHTPPITCQLACLPASSVQNAYPFHPHPPPQFLLVFNFQMMRLFLPEVLPDAPILLSAIHCARRCVQHYMFTCLSQCLPTKLAARREREPGCPGPGRHGEDYAGGRTAVDSAAWSCGQSGRRGPCPGRERQVHSIPGSADARAATQGWQDVPRGREGGSRNQKVGDSREALPALHSLWSSSPRRSGNRGTEQSLQASGRPVSARPSPCGPPPPLPRTSRNFSGWGWSRGSGG